MKLIAPNVYTFQGLTVGRVYLIEDPDGLTIIDSGIINATFKLINQFKASDHKLGDIKQILLTHAHPDHIGALPALKYESGAPIITSEIEKPIAEGTVSIPRPSSGLRMPDYRVQGIKVDRTVKEGEVIDALGGLQVIATPGHSPGHISFWQPERKILFVGDVMMNAFGLRQPVGFVTVDQAENIRSIKKLAQFDAQIACFGHGQSLTNNTAARIRAFAQRF